MKLFKQLLTAAGASILFMACQKQQEETVQPTNEEILSHSSDNDNWRNNNHQGYVYTMSNESSGNRILVYRRGNDGKLTQADSYTTGGNGTGTGLGNQGALILGANNKLLFAVNAGSNTISVFRITKNGLKLWETVSSGGIMPVSLTMENNLLYVLNGGSPSNITGFRLTYNGLQRIHQSTKPLSTENPGPAQVSFVNNGRVLVITEKATNLITTYQVTSYGIPFNRRSTASASPTPFGFAAGNHGLIIVSEAAGGAPAASALTSYRVHENGTVTKITGPVSASQTAACWVVLSGNGKYAYTTNTASGNISSYISSFFGNLRVAEAIAGDTGEGSGPIDAALTGNSRFLYILNSGNESISGFKINSDGRLVKIQDQPGLPDGSNGLVAN